MCVYARAHVHAHVHTHLPIGWLCVHECRCPEESIIFSEAGVRVGCELRTELGTSARATPILATKSSFQPE